MTERWYARDADAVAARLDANLEAGLSAEQVEGAAGALGPNALPTEEPTPGWRRFLDEYRSYMQMILVGAAVVSLAIKEWSTAVVLVAITLLNAVVGLRQQGKAESAMNALKSMMKETARVRRGGAEAEIPAEELVPGDIVLLAAGDQVPADGRLIAASSLQIDESALTGESTPAAKVAEPLPDEERGPGDQTNMAFMHTPVTHGSGVMIVTGTGSDTQVGHIAGMLAATATEETPLTKQMNTLTLWIAGAAGVTMVIMFALGLHRGDPWRELFITAVALAISAIPEALPTVVQVVLSLGSVELAGRNAIVKELPSVETLGFTSAINSDKTGTLTMNQMTAVEVVDTTDRFTISGIGYGLEGRVHHAAGGVEHERGRDPAVRRRKRRPPRGRQGDRRPHRGRVARARAQGRSRHRRDPRGASAAGDAAVRSDLQADGDVQPRDDAATAGMWCASTSRGPRRRCSSARRPRSRAPRASRGTTISRSAPTST